MDKARFDEISKLFSQRRLNRRRAMWQGTAGLAAAGLAAAGLKVAAAQDSTPSADASPAAVGDAASTAEFLFLQSFESGAIAPKPGAEGTFTVTLQHGLGQTLYFSDRPERIVGAAPTPQFLEGFGFGPDNPPNAALLVDSGDGGLNIAVVELTNPTYDEASSTATYDIAVLRDYDRTAGMRFQEEPSDLTTLDSSFGKAHLFIDDCANGSIDCQIDGRTVSAVAADQPFCWNYSVCIPCEPYGHAQPDRCSTISYWTEKCNDLSSDCAGRRCRAYFLNQDLLC